MARATIINSLLSTHDKALPPNFWPALTELQARITALVSPLQQPPDPPSSFHESLSYILLSAACLSLDMRRKPSAIYYMRPVTRESALDSSTTHVLNSDRFAHDQIYHDEFHEPIVRIAAWPIVDVYRPSRSNPSSSSPSSSERDEGDSDSDSSDSSHFFNDNYKNNPKRQSGLSVRRICKGEAYVEWGVLAPVYQRAHFRDHVPSVASGQNGIPATISPPDLQSTSRLSLRQDVAARIFHSPPSALSVFHSRFVRPVTLILLNNSDIVVMIGIVFLAVAVAFVTTIPQTTKWTQSEIVRRVIQLFSSRGGGGGGGVGAGGGEKIHRGDGGEDEVGFWLRSRAGDSGHGFWANTDHEAKIETETERASCVWEFYSAIETIRWMSSGSWIEHTGWKGEDRELRGNVCVVCVLVLLFLI